jgi:hypothetical protein
MPCELKRRERESKGVPSWRYSSGSISNVLVFEGHCIGDDCCHAVSLACLFRLAGIRCARRGPRTWRQFSFVAWEAHITLPRPSISSAGEGAAPRSDIQSVICVHGFQFEGEEGSQTWGHTHCQANPCVNPWYLFLDISYLFI